MNILAAIVVAVLFGCGVELAVRRDVIKLAAGMVLLTNAAILMLVSSGFGAYEIPILPVSEPREVADPLVQALALTAIVIGFGTTVLLLRVGLAVRETHGTIDFEDLVRTELDEAVRNEDQDQA